MTPGTRVDRELSNIDRVCGQLGYMIIKKKLWRSTLITVANQLESSAHELRRIAESAK